MSRLARSGQVPAGDEQPPLLAGSPTLSQLINAGQSESEQRSADTEDEAQAGAATAAAFGSLLSIPQTSPAIQILTEYVSGLLEDGPVADAFAKAAALAGGRPGTDEEEERPGTDEEEQAPSAEQALNPSPAEEQNAEQSVTSPGEEPQTPSGNGPGTNNEEDNPGTSDEDTSGGSTGMRD